MPEPVDHVGMAGHKTSRGRQGLRERTDPDMHAVGAACLLDQAAAAHAEHTRRMRLVHHQDRPVLSRQFAEVGQRRDRAVHRKDRVGDDQATAGGVGLREDRIERGHVAVRIDADPSAREPAAVDDARVVAGVAGDHIVGTDECRDRGGVGGKAAGKGEGRIHREQVRQRPLEEFMGLRVAAHQRAGTGAKSLGAGGLRRGLCEADVAGVSEIVIGPEVEERLPVEIDLPALPARSHAVGPLEPRGAEGVEIVGDPVECRRQWRSGLRRLVRSLGGIEAARHAQIVDERSGRTVAAFLPSFFFA